MAESVKILELTGANWLGGIAPHPFAPIGGLFKVATNFDPFSKVGLFTASEGFNRRSQLPSPADYYVNFIRTTVAAGNPWAALGILPRSDATP